MVRFKHAYLFNPGSSHVAVLRLIKSHPSSTEPQGSSKLSYLHNLGPMPSLLQVKEDYSNRFY